ncbi:hypothetical protein F4780DRAFT_740485 [Xylariomycetidae sp. FL0641]|nr:hypothetical protein F4780DRAFT_740485 [Xylariomycetidae sp. FL0641]
MFILLPILMLILTRVRMLASYGVHQSIGFSMTQRPSVAVCPRFANGSPQRTAIGIRMVPLSLHPWGECLRSTVCHGLGQSNSAGG